MIAKDLLARLEELGVVLFAEGDRLKVSAGRGQLDEELRREIGAHKAELLDLLAARGAPGSPAPIPRVAREPGLPLSYFQERLWVIQRLQPESTAYNLVARWWAPAGHDADRVAGAMRSLFARHEILRTAFAEEGGTVRARPAEPAADPVALEDLSGLPGSAQQARIEADTAAATTRPCDLASGVPARCTIYRLGEARSVVLLAAHHIAVDAWSIGLLARQMADLLEGRLGAGGADELQYGDFAAWQRRDRDPRAVAAQLDWWAGVLHGAPPLSSFPPDRTPDSRGSGANHAFALDAVLTAGLKAMVREEGATVYMALVAACAAVLRFHTGQEDLLLGCPMGVRERPEFESMIGPFVNLQVLRLNLEGDPGFAALLHRARGAVLDAHAHRDVPFEMLIERLRPARSFEHAPLFQVAVVEHNALPGEGLRVEGGGALHELTWFASEIDGAISCTLEYRSDLYTARAIERIAAHLQAMLRSAVEDRHRPLSRVSLLVPGERERLLVEFNATSAGPSPDRFTAQFERQAARAPERVALVSGTRSLAYGELNRCANRLARHLRSLGIGPGKRVALFLERTPELVVALIAVLKSGGAYVPLDPGFPAGRLDFMLEDSDASVLITAGGSLPGTGTPAPVRVVDLSLLPSELAALDDSNLETPGAPEDPAYVIYTSGSTGRPKGVVIPHGALANFLGSLAREPGLDEDDVVAAVTTISFDIAGLELYLPLTVGARVALLSRETAADALALAGALAESGASVLQATPATWRMLLESDWRPQPGLRAFCGGEALSRELAKDLLERVPALWNLYGPTETTIWSTLERVSDPDCVTIGRPIANTRIYVVGPEGEPVPVGMAGEIWIGGAGVALGYHRRPELTAERFVPDRFGPDAQARLYRTGDVGRWRDDGRLEHLGRVDHQVKIRGFRIELGEVESALASHEAVRRAVVLAREASPGDARLVAYLVYEPGEEPTASEIRRFVRRQLPDYMVPSVFVAVDAIPSTPNGKTDRAALPDPFQGSRRADRGHEPPAPGLEQLLADAWCEVLKVERVGAHDNFFELGGHSLLALRVATAVERKCGWRLDPRALFFQSLRQVAASRPGSAP